MTKTLSVLALAVAVLIAAVALMVVDTEKVRARSTCPSGTQKFAHMCIEETAHNNTLGNPQITSFSDASSTCANLGRRLPTAPELDAFRQQPGITLGALGTADEWVGDFLDQSSALTMTDSGSYSTGVASGTTVSLRPFRCVA